MDVQLVHFRGDNQSISPSLQNCELAILDAVERGFKDLDLLEPQAVNDFFRDRQVSEVDLPDRLGLFVDLTKERFITPYGCRVIRALTCALKEEYSIAEVVIALEKSELPKDNLSIVLADGELCEIDLKDLISLIVSFPGAFQSPSDDEEKISSIFNGASMACALELVRQVANEEVLDYQFLAEDDHGTWTPSEVLKHIQPTILGNREFYIRSDDGDAFQLSATGFLKFLSISAWARGFLRYENFSDSFDICVPGVNTENLYYTLQAIIGNDEISLLEEFSGAEETKESEEIKGEEINSESYLNHLLSTLEVCKFLIIERGMLRTCCMYK